MFDLSENDRKLLRPLFALVGKFLKVPSDTVEKIIDYLPELMTIAAKDKRGREILSELGVQNLDGFENGE